MPAGLVVYGDHGRFQIDGSTPNIVLRRVVQAATTTTTGAGSQYVLPLASDEFAAFVCAAPCLPDRLTGSGQVFSVRAPVGQQVAFYVFGPTTTASSNYGLVVLNDAGQVVFDATQKQFRALGVTSGNGTFSYGGRAIAVIPKAVKSALVRGAGGVFPTITLSATLTSGMATVSGDSVTVADLVSSGSAFGPVTSIPSNWAGTWSNNMVTEFVVIDVTNY